ncbi:Protein kinase-like protein [Penicillium sp. IBT 31633x]|nr:Protein kinase-like protein [Penicillium sp. IBT 31633x]
MDTLSNFQLQNFFKQQSPITREICNEVATIIASGGTVKSTPLQGIQSYTVQISDGIVDWGDAKVGPFAMHLSGLENISGIRKTTCMALHLQHIDFRQLFWKTIFKEIGDGSEEVTIAIQTARMVGICMANDFIETSEQEQKMYLAVLE